MRGGGEYFKGLVLTLSMLLLLILFSGCASPIDLSKTKSIPKDEGVAFGRVKAVVEGEIEDTSRMSLLILPDGSSKVVKFALEDDGFFFWHLPPGGYSIADFEGRFFGYHLGGRVFAHFDVLKDELTYIGTLKLVLDKGGQYWNSVEDEYEVAIAQFRKEFPEIKGETRRSLMVMEKRR